MDDCSELSFYDLHFVAEERKNLDLRGVIVHPARAMKTVLSIGAGGVGHVVAHKCAQMSDVYESIHLASRTKSKCDAIAADVLSREGVTITTHAVDADDVAATVALIKEVKADLVLNVALPYQDLPLMDACLTRLGVRHYFEFTLSCDTVGAGKNSPLVYLTAAERLGAKPEETAVYEDSCFAAATAKNAGFYLCGVYDPVSDIHWEELKALSHEAIAHW